MIPFLSASVSVPILDLKPFIEAWGINWEFFLTGGAIVILLTNAVKQYFNVKGKWLLIPNVAVSFVVSLKAGNGDIVTILVATVALVMFSILTWNTAKVAARGVSNT